MGGTHNQICLFSHKYNPFFGKTSTFNYGKCDGSIGRAKSLTKKNNGCQGEPVFPGLPTLLLADWLNIPPMCLDRPNSAVDLAPPVRPICPVGLVRLLRLVCPVGLIRLRSLVHLVRSVHPVRLARPIGSVCPIRQFSFIQNVLSSGNKHWKIYFNQISFLHSLWLPYSPYPYYVKFY